MNHARGLTYTGKSSSITTYIVQYIEKWIFGRQINEQVMKHPIGPAIL